MNPTVSLTVPQLAVLGLAIIIGSFTLNGVFFSRFIGDFRGRLERIEKSVSGDTGLVVAVAVQNTRITALERDRRVGLPDRRHRQQSEDAG